MSKAIPFCKPPKKCQASGFSGVLPIHKGGVTPLRLRCSQEAQKDLPARPPNPSPPNCRESKDKVEVLKHHRPKRLSPRSWSETPRQGGSPTAAWWRNQSVKSHGCRAPTRDGVVSPNRRRPALDSRDAESRHQDRRQSPDLDAVSHPKGAASFSIEQNPVFPLAFVLLYMQSFLGF